MDNQQIGAFFQNTSVDIIGNESLREPQIGGYQAVQAHFTQSREHAILQIPVGCGKTGLMSILPFRLAQGRVLVIAPNLEIRRGVANSLNVTSNDCFWRKTGVLGDFSSGPFELSSTAKQTFMIVIVLTLSLQIFINLPVVPTDGFRNLKTTSSTLSL